MYSVDLKNIVPKGGLTCLFAKATSDESKLWHRSLGHLNFKTMNKLVKENLVRGLPSKLFKNEETCVACQKGKQHRASYPKSYQDDESKPSSDVEKKVDEDSRKKTECNDQEKEDNTDIGDLQSATQTRNMSKNLEEYRKNPKRKRAIGTKWVFKNKKDERGIMIRNKVRLVSQGYIHEEGIDYDKVFSPVARIKAIKLFLAYDSFKDFVVYQMGVKSAFLYKKIEEEVYQKKDGIFISQDKYVGDILKKFGFIKVKSASTPMETQKPLLKDEDGEEVVVHIYRSMIGSLMYLTSSRPDIMFAVCACARYQVNLKVSHLHAMKRILRYLKGQPKLGLWYPKDSRFDLVAYTYSDYAGANLDRKSIIGGCQFLRCRLIS
ncbi:uncharacterized mitochondrial protein-like protein [Tanacetum coccineum]